MRLCLEAGGIPVVACQEHGKSGPWLDECSAAGLAKGWKVVAAPAVVTGAQGTSAGVLLACPSCLNVAMAPGQTTWDLLPGVAPGRLVMANVEVKTIGWILVFGLPVDG